MTPEEREKIRLDLLEYIVGTVDEWLSGAHVLQTPEDPNGLRVKIRWEHVTDGALIASLSETGYGDECGRYGVHIDVTALAPQERSDAEGNYTSPPVSAPDQPKWWLRTWDDVRQGDRVRIPGAEPVTVLNAINLDWHVVAGGRGWWDDQPLDHGHVHVRLSHNPGRLYAMTPGDPVQIELTDAEVQAIEMLGGWQYRLLQTTHPAPTS